MNMYQKTINTVFKDFRGVSLHWIGIPLLIMFFVNPGEFMSGFANGVSGQQEQVNYR